MRKIAMLLVVIALNLFGCVAYDPGIEIGCKKIWNKPGYQEEIFKDIALNIIDVDKEGELRDRCQWTKALDTVSKYNKDAPQLIVLYVHGWKHNSDDNDYNSVKFEEFFRLLHEEDKEKRRVVGIYFSWDAKATGIDIIDNLTFWNKKEVADRISQSSVLTKLIGALDNIRTRRNNANDSVVYIGHSFGARILFTATSQNLIRNVQFAFPQTDSNLNESRDISGTYNKIECAGDIIVLLNPAMEATFFTQFYTLRRPSETFNAEQQPLILSLSAENDLATSFFFPLGQILAGRFSERARKTLGNYSPYITHEVGPCLKMHPNQSSPGVAWFDNYSSSGVCIKSKHYNRQHNPFIVASAKEEFINGHSKIWTHELRQWLVSFIGKLYTKRGRD